MLQPDEQILDEGRNVLTYFGDENNKSKKLCSEGPPRDNTDKKNTCSNFQKMRLEQLFQKQAFWQTDKQTKWVTYRERDRREREREKQRKNNERHYGSGER